MRGKLHVLACLAAPVIAAAIVETYLRGYLDRETPVFASVLLPPSRWHELAWRIGRLHTSGFILLITVGASLLAANVGLWNGRSKADVLSGIAKAHFWVLLLAFHQVAFFGTSADPQAFSVLAIIVRLTPMVVSFALAGWLAGLWNTAFPVTDGPNRGRSAVVKLALAAITCAAVFSALSILQYRALHVPHGDTGMYEEHLWNFWHGKGFRSQLDDGRLFLGEHFEVIHLLLSPIYLLYPYLPTLNVIQSVALASGALAVYSIARSRGLSPTAGWTLGAAYLLYFPMQYLILEATWKTFRPESLGVPLVLFALAAMEAHRYRTMLLLLGLCLLAKEEYAIVVGGIGVWIACRSDRGPLGRAEVWFGIGIVLFAVVFLLAVLLVAIPYFRHGAAPHYTPYFRTIISNPSLVMELVFQFKKFQFVLLMLGPIALMPLFSPRRLLLSAPVFGYLILGDSPFLTEPWFHFHGPLVPLLWWAAVGGVANLGAVFSAEALARLVFAMALVTGIWFGRSPLSWKFHDPLEGVPRADGLFEPAGAYWRDVYLPTERSRAFATAAATVRPEERVAATDYVRTRFTHHRAAHDYPTFRAHVKIGDVDVIFIDKTEGWWGRATNPDRELLACLDDGNCQPGKPLTIRGGTFSVVHHDAYFLVARKVPAGPPRNEGI